MRPSDAWKQNYNGPILTQMRNVLALEKTVIDNVSEGRDYVVIDGKERHIVSYLEDFLFAPQCLRSPVKNTVRGRKKSAVISKTI